MLFRLLKNVNNWVYKSFKAISDAEDRYVKSMFEEKIDADRFEE